MLPAKGGNLEKERDDDTSLGLNLGHHYWRHARGSLPFELSEPAARQWAHISSL